jgi:polyisoprenoid-binding protein YceI
MSLNHEAISVICRMAGRRKVRGGFQTFEGTVGFDEKSPAASKVDATIPASSVDARASGRDSLFGNFLLLSRVFVR